LARALHGDSSRQALSTDDERQPDPSFPADHRELCRVAVLQNADQRDDATGGEVEMLDRSVDLVQDLPECQVDVFQRWQNATELVRRERTEQTIISGECVHDERNARCLWYS